MRLIDADALTEIIHGMYAEGDDPSTYHVDVEGDTLIGKFAVVDAIFNMPTIQPEPHWIPVTERLPKSKEEDLEYPTVLICFENEEVMLGCFYESTKEWGTGEYFDKKCNPIAWMPKPEPYKGVTE